MNDQPVINISIGDTIRSIMVDSVEFAHLKYFLDIYIHDNYQMYIALGNTHYIVHNILKSEQPYHHYSYSNCVEWIFNNCEVIKEKL